MVSIIVPVYNVEKYIEECIDSLINQTYKDIEVILVDDGSTDASGEICDRYAQKDSRVKVYHNENGGPSKARNFGLDKATGEFVTFIDSDDWIESEAIELLISVIEDDIDVIFFNLREVNSTNVREWKMFESSRIEFTDDNKEELENILLIPEKYTSKLILGITGSVCKLYRRESIANCKFPEKLNYAEDYCFIAQVIRNVNKLLYIDNVLYNYRIRKNSLCHNLEDESIIKNQKLVKWFLDYYRDNKKYDILNEFIFRYYGIVVSNVIINKDYSKKEKKKMIKEFLEGIDFKYDFKRVDIKCKNRNLQIAWFLLHKKMFRMLYLYNILIKIKKERLFIDKT